MRRTNPNQYRYLTVLAVLVSAMTWSLETRADFEDGLAAYDGGDYGAAIAAWRPLAEAGDAEAQIALAELYEIGLGVAADLQAAFALYRRAAQAGDPVAQLNLGEFFARGRGTAVDPLAAYVWLSRAAAQGRVWAAARRDELRAVLSADDLAEAERQLAE